MLDISIVTNDANRGIYIANSIFTFFHSLRLEQIIYNFDNLKNSLIRYKVDMIIFDMFLNKKDEKDLLIFLDNKLFQNTDIIFITQNTYNIDFANHISFVKSEDRTENYYRNIVEKWFLTKTDMEFEKLVKSELYKLNFNFSYKGTTYIIDILKYLYDNQIYDDHINFQKLIYPYLAKKYNRSISSIKTSILNSIENMYCECDSNIFKEYFYTYEDYRIKTKELIFNILDKIIKKPLSERYDRGKKISDAIP